jgi:Ca2+-binding RTX toxin-like protein
MLKAFIQSVRNYIRGSGVGSIPPYNVYNGDPGNDQIIGSTGNDQINGQGGDDILNGGAGNDILAGGNGNDVLWGWYWGR